jgi:hypothetical protein
MYCVKFCDGLRGKFGFLAEGNSEGFREQAKAANILADCLEVFTEGNEGKEGGAVFQRD